VAGTREAGGTAAPGMEAECCSKGQQGEKGQSQEEGLHGDSSQHSRQSGRGRAGGSGAAAEPEGVNCWRLGASRQLQEP